jgi:NADH:ubiquinone oxidoreductase subunit F (NADH-binding)
LTSSTTVRPVPDARSLPRLLSRPGDSGLDAHLRLWGPVPFGGVNLIYELQKAGLKGRGGAGFPMAVKMRAVAAARRRSVVVANGTEGEPASRKDKALLTASPHLVFDGMSVAAEAVGAEEAILCVDRHATGAIHAAVTALGERRQVGLERIPVRIETTPNAYVAGEESALIHWLNGGEAKPVFVPPRPFQKGVRGRPTLVNNVETLAHLALVARFGASWFRAVGTEADSGTALVTVSGDVARPGVYEAALGGSLTDVVNLARPARAPQALLVGGYAGTWMPGAAAQNLTIDSVSLGQAGATLGCGVIAVLGPDGCGLVETASIVDWMAGQSAGQCGPCVHGLPAVAGALDHMVAGDRRGRAESQLRRWLGMISGRGACRHPDGVVRLVKSALEVFPGEIERHRRRGPCRARAGFPTPSHVGGWR